MGVMMKHLLLPLSSLVLSTTMFLGSHAFLPKHDSSRVSMSKTRPFASSAVFAAESSLPPVVDIDGSALTPEKLSEKLENKRVALYFAAGWCPMCTSFEPSLLQFRDAAEESGKPVEIIYVPSDRSSADQVKRSSAMGMLSVPIGEDADNAKRKFKVWSGAEAIKLGFGRRSGVPALVVLSKEGEEMAFVAAESEGVRALKSWPLGDESGVWTKN